MDNKEPNPEMSTDNKTIVSKQIVYLKNNSQIEQISNSEVKTTPIQDTRSATIVSKQVVYFTNKAKENDIPDDK